MKTHSRLLMLGLFALIAALGTEFTWGQQIQWANSIEEAQARAKIENKIVQIHFWATYCGPCRQMEAFVFPVPAIAKKMNQNVVAVKVDIEKHRDLAQQFHITTIPQDVFLDQDGKVLHRRISPTNSQNYSTMLDTAVRIAAQSTRQSEMAMEALTQMTQKKVEAQQQSRFLGEAAAQAGNAEQMFAKVGGITPPSANGVLPSAIPTATMAAPTDALANATQQVNHLLETRMPEARFTESSFPQAQIPKTTAPFPQPPVANTTPANTDALLAQQSLPAAATPTAPQLPQLGQTSANRAGREQPNPQLTKSNLPQASLAGLQADSAQPPATNIASQSVAGTSMAAEHQQVSAHQEETPHKPQFGLDGYCPVSLLQHQKWVKGDPQHGRVHRGKVYLFASAEMANQFFASPDQLSPALAGYDPVSFSNSGELVEGKREFGVFCESDHGTMIVLFANQENRDTFKANREQYLERIRVATTAADTR